MKHISARGLLIGSAIVGGFFAACVPDAPPWTGDDEAGAAGVGGAGKGGSGNAGQSGSAAATGGNGAAHGGSASGSGGSRGSEGGEGGDGATGGESGDSGSGGTGGRGGSAGSGAVGGAGEGGKAGAGGRGGMAGLGGLAGSATAGSAGNAGSAGSGGQPGGSSGASGSGGTGGAAGTSGSGGSAGVAGSGGSCTGSGTVASWSDGFDSQTLDAAWAVWEYSGQRHNSLSSPANHFSLTDNVGSLRYVVDPMTEAAAWHDYAVWWSGWYYFDPGVELAREIGGTRWVVESKATWHVPRVVNSAGFQLTVHWGPLGTAGFACFLRRTSNDDVGAGTNPDVNVIQAMCDDGSEAHQWAGLDVDIMRYVRFQRTDATLTIDLSADAAAWNTLLTASVPAEFLCDAQRVELSGNAWFSPQGSYADYDYVSFTRQDP